MRRLTLSLLFVAILLPSAQAQDVMERPTWSVGDEWSYFVNGTYPGPDGPQPFAYVGKSIVAARETLDGVEALRVVDLSKDVDPSTDAASWLGKPVDLPRDGRLLWVRASDGAHLQRGETRPQGDKMEWTTTVNVGGCDVYLYPYSVGREPSSGAPCEQRPDKGPGNTFTPYAQVTGIENVTVPAGTFRAFVVGSGANGQAGEVHWYAPEVCWRVKAQGVPGNSVTMQLLGWRCGNSSGGVATPLPAGLDVAAIRAPMEVPWPAPLGVLVLAFAALVRRR